MNKSYEDHSGEGCELMKALFKNTMLEPETIGVRESIRNFTGHFEPDFHPLNPR